MSKRQKPKKKTHQSFPKNFKSSKKSFSHFTKPKDIEDIAYKVFGSLYDSPETD